MKIYTKTGDDGNTDYKVILELQNHIQELWHMEQWMK